jgi:hypothetical protein
MASPVAGAAGLLAKFILGKRKPLLAALTSSMAEEWGADPSVFMLTWEYVVRDENKKDKTTIH